MEIKEKEMKSDLLNNYMSLLNDGQKKKTAPTKDKKKQNSKTNTNFQKVTCSGSINTSGNVPIVVFKKTTNKKGTNDSSQLGVKNNTKKQKNEYISDGGMSNKMQKYSNNLNNNININNNNNSNNNMNNIYFNNYIIEKNQQIPNNKNIKNKPDNNSNLKKNKEQQKIFSKTVREFNKRPAIQKNDKSKELCNSYKNGKKFKNKSVNPNINSNSGNITGGKTHAFYQKANPEESKLQEEKKLIMKQLVENGVVNEIKKLQNKKKSSQKEKKDERKREILENQGLPIDFYEEEEEEKSQRKKRLSNKSHNEEISKNSESNNANNINSLQKKFLSKTTRGFYPKINNYLFPYEENTNNNNDEKNNQIRSKRLKPSVNQFEYINKIYSEKRKLNYNLEMPPENININHSNNIFQKRKIKSVNVELNDSFRHHNIKEYNSLNINKNNRFKNRSCNNELTKKSIEDIQDEFPFAHRKNHRTSEEIKKFVKTKKLQHKKKEDDILLEKNKKLFLLFKNLYNLNMKDFSKGIPVATSEQFYTKSSHQATTSSRGGKAVMPSKINMQYNNSNKNDTTSSNNNLNNNNKIRKKKELNEYYIGNDSTIKNNNSTLIDPNEYYLNVLESQQLFVNSGLNKIENDSDTSEQNESDVNNLNISKEQIQKITSKESKKSTSSKKNNNLILKTNEYDDLKKRIDNTLKRAGKMFSNKDTNNGTTEKNNEKSEIPKKAENKGKLVDIINNKKGKSPEINIESSNKEQQKITNENNNTGVNTKEKNIPSLSHTYSTKSNPNKKVEIEIEPRAVINLVEVIKFIIQRKIFVLLYESYIKRAIYQQYNIAFAYFVAVCKHYPFRKLEEYCSYKTYKYAFRHLFKPFMRNAFKHFIKKCYTRRKIVYLVLFLDKFLKNKILLKIFNFAEIKKKIREENKKKVKPFVNLLKNIYLKSNFTQFKKNVNSSQPKSSDKKDEKFKKIENVKNNEKDGNDEENYDLNERENLHRRKTEGTVKMNSYLYESFGSDSKSLSLEPNSEDNDRLHQLKMMLLIKNNYGNLDNSNDIDLESNSNSNSMNNSYGKIYSKRNEQQKINAKINISDDEDIKIKESYKKNIPNDNKNNSIEMDISADNDKSNEIEWGYNLNSLNEKEKENKNKKAKKSIESDDLNEEYNDFEMNLIDKDEKVGKEKENIKEKKIAAEEKDELNLIKNEIKQDKSRNLKQDEKEDAKVNKDIDKADEKEKKINEEKNLEQKEKEKEKEKEDKEKEKERLREIFSKKVKEIKNPEQLADELTEDILNKLLSTEIKSSKKKLVPPKKFKFDKFDKMNSQNNSLNNSYGSVGNSHDQLSREFGLSGLSQLSLQDELLSLNDSIMSNYSAHSVFNKTIKDKKKEQSLGLYFKVIAPKLIKLIYKEIIDKYPLIYENISTPMKNNSEKLMISLALQDAELLRDNYKTTKNLVSIAKILEKDNILKKFEPINKKIRSYDNVTSDNFYDKMLNDCIVETAIEIINKERLYGKNGEPLKWSSRSHELAFKYKKNEPKKLANYVCKKLYFAIKNKVGLISDNFDNMSPDQLNYERDKRLTNIIKRDLDEYEYQWNNLEMEETQLKVDNSELIMDQLYNEVIEILEHIQYSRIRSDLYQNKSIYACEEIPKLAFQLTTTEDANIPEGNDTNNNTNTNNNNI